MRTRVCGDCLVWLVNADDSGLDRLPEKDAAEYRERRDAYFAGTGHWVPVDEEPHFSWYGCNACSPNLGNDVYEVEEI